MPVATKVARSPKIGDESDSTLDLKTYVTTTILADNYWVTFPDETATPLDAETATDGTTSIPAIGATYSGSEPGDALICFRVRAKRRTQKKNMFDVTVQFQDLGGAVPSKSTEKWHINVSVDPVTYEQDAYRDFNGRAITNTAGQVMSPTLKKVYFDDDVNISFDTSNAQAVLDAVASTKGHYNAADVTMSINGVTRTFPANSLLFVAPRYSTIYVGQPPYDWKFSLVFRYRALNADKSGGWIDKVPDRGRCVLDANNKPTPPVGGFGRTPDGSVLLNGAGQLLPGTAGGGVVTPKYLTFDMYGPADFTALLSGIT